MAERQRREAAETEYRARNTFGDLAYDLDYAEREYRLRHAGEEEQREEFIRPASRPQQEPERKAAASPRRAPLLSPAFALCSVAILGVLFMTILGYVALNDVSREIVSLQKQVETLSQENVDLTTRHELTFDLATIKQQAEASGMSKPSDSQTYYMDLAGKDSAVIYETAESSTLLKRAGSSIRAVVSAAVEYLR